jgi:hypothetical protein
MVALMFLTDALQTLAQKKVGTVDPQTKTQLDGLNQKYVTSLQSNDAGRWTLSLLKMRYLSPTRDRSTGEKKLKPISETFSRMSTSLNTGSRRTPLQCWFWLPIKMCCNGNWSMTFELPNGKRMAEEGFWSAVEVKDGDTWKHQLLTFNLIPK